MKRRRASAPPPERDAPYNPFRRLNADVFQLLADDVLRRRGASSLALFLGAVLKDRLTEPLVRDYTLRLASRFRWKATPVGPDQRVKYVLKRLRTGKRCAGCGNLVSDLVPDQCDEFLDALGADAATEVCSSACWERLFPGQFMMMPKCSCPPPIRPPNGWRHLNIYPCPPCTVRHVQTWHPAWFPPVVYRDYLAFAEPIVRIFRGDYSADDSDKVHWILLSLREAYPRRTGETDRQLVLRFLEIVTRILRTSPADVAPIWRTECRALVQARISERLPPA